MNPGNLLVFIGRRIEVRQVLPPAGEIWFDKKFEARYEILSVVYGDYRERQIQFSAYDHKTPYEMPSFAANDIVLLYVSKHEGGLVHEKYQFDDVYPTRDGRWAGCGSPYPSPVYRAELSPHPIEFQPSVTFNVAGLTPEQIQRQYPAPHFEVRGTAVVCRNGLYADELFEVRKRDVLQARGLFRMEDGR